MKNPRPLPDPYWFSVELRRMLVTIAPDLPIGVTIIANIEKEFREAYGLTGYGGDDIKVTRGDTRGAKLTQAQVAAMRVIDACIAIRKPAAYLERIDSMLDRSSSSATRRLVYRFHRKSHDEALDRLQKALYEAQPDRLARAQQRRTLKALSRKGAETRKNAAARRRPKLDADVHAALKINPRLSNLALAMRLVKKPYCKKKGRKRITPDYLATLIGELRAGKK